MIKSVVIQKFKSLSWKEKLIAFAVHFGISLLIFLILLYFIFYQWYPHPFFTTDGGTQGLRLIIFVDLVLGPTLTFVVFNKLKRGLKIDLALIALLQISALFYGAWVVYHERPVAVIFSDDRFNPIPYYQVAEAGIPLSDLAKYGSDNPVKIYVALPDNIDERGKIFLKSYRTQRPIFLMGELYRKIDSDIKQKIAEKSVNMEEYLKEPYLRHKIDIDVPQMEAAYQQFIKTSDRPPSDYLYLALFARYGRFIAVLDKETFEFIDVLDIEPPQITKYLPEAKPGDKPSDHPDLR